MSLRTIKTPASSVSLFVSSKALAAALDRAEPRGNLPGLGPESVAPSRRSGPFNSIGCGLRTFARRCGQREVWA